MTKKTESPTIFTISIIFGGGAGMAVANMLGYDGGGGFFIGASVFFLSLAIPILISRSQTTALQEELDLIRSMLIDSFIRPIPKEINFEISTNDAKRKTSDLDSDLVELIDLIAKKEIDSNDIMLLETYLSLKLPKKKDKLSSAILAINILKKDLELQKKSVLLHSKEEKWQSNSVS